MDFALLQRLWPVFVEEAREHLQEIAAGVLALEKGDAPEGTLHALRRTAHGLKGSAASLGLIDIEKLSHAMESALADRSEKDGLEAGRVEALLAAVDAGEAALRLGDGGKEPSIATLAEILAALAGEPVAEGPAQKEKEQEKEHEPEPAALDQVWPVFRAEAQEHLARLAAAFDAARAERGFSEEEAASLAQVAKSLSSSASVLGLGEMEKHAARLQELLLATGLRPNAKKLKALKDVVLRLEAAIGPAPEQPVAQPATPSARAQADQSLTDIFRKEALEVLQVLEGSLTRLCSPSADAERGELVEEAVRRAHNLKGSAGAVGAKEIAQVAGRLQAALGRMAAPGLEASRAAAAAAEDIVGLRTFVDAFGHEPEPAPVPEAKSEAVSAGAVPGERTIRVSVQSLESLARQVETFTLLRAREERRARELSACAASVQEIRGLVERSLEELRHASLGADAPNAALEDVIGRIRSQERALARMGQEHSREAEQIRLVSTVVREDLRDLRMVPASTALEPLRRTVREVAGRLRKPVELTITGGEVRLDRRILEELKEPLQHLVRNAVDHGFETAEVRRAAGKRAAGALEVRVERRGHRIAVMVVDDGAGISAARVREVAVRRGLLSAQAAAQVTDDEARQLIFRPEFTTSEHVTDISGRGVGLDVVQNAARRLRGTVDLVTAEGKGTRFVMDLPLTLAATLAVVVRAGGDFAALPYEAVERILRLTEKDLGTVAGRASVLVDGVQLPFAALAQVVGADPGRLSLESGKPQPSLLVNAGGTRLVLAVDEVAGQHEVVVQSLGRHLARTAHLGGAAVLDDGKVVSVLNVAELVRLARPLARGAGAEGDRPCVLVVDDSLTTRSAMKAVLEIAGYRVVPASDGEEALLLLKRTSGCQLVVTDVQMPGMDGFTLTRRLKSEPASAHLPVIVVTSLDTPSDRAAGLEAGADAYLVKRDVERGKLLVRVRQLMPMGAGA